MASIKFKAAFLLVLAAVSCKTTDKFDSGSVLASFQAPDAANTAVILVHGWGSTPRWPRVVWRLKLEPYADLSNLRDRFKSAGFAAVHVIDYDDEGSVDQMAGTVAKQIQAIVAKANNPNLKLDVVGHSLGEFVALKAIVENPIAPGSSEKISDRVRLFVGLAGVARGQDNMMPCNFFPNQCGGLEDLTPYYRGPGRGSRVVDKLFSENGDAINKLKKCSLYSRDDEIVDSPYNSGSFSGLGLDPANIKDVEIGYGGRRFHRDIKDSPQLINKMFTSCYDMLN